MEIEFLVGKKQLGKIVTKCIEMHGTKVASQVLDDIKSQGFKYSTKGAITVAACDATVPPKRKNCWLMQKHRLNVHVNCTNAVC